MHEPLLQIYSTLSMGVVTVGQHQQTTVYLVNSNIYKAARIRILMQFI